MKWRLKTNPVKTEVCAFYFSNKLVPMNLSGLSGLKILNHIFTLKYLGVDI